MKKTGNLHNADRVSSEMTQHAAMCDRKTTAVEIQLAALLAVVQFRSLLTIHRTDIGDRCLEPRRQPIPVAQNQHEVTVL